MFNCASAALKILMGNPVVDEIEKKSFILFKGKLFKGKEHLGIKAGGTPQPPGQNVKRSPR